MLILCNALVQLLVKTLYTFILHTWTECEFTSVFKGNNKGQETKLLTANTNILVSYT